MKQILTCGSAVLSILTAGLVQTVSAAHVHQRGDIVGHVLHKRKATSSSNLDKSDSNWTVLPLASQDRASQVTSCTDNTCSRPKATTYVTVTTTITPVILETRTLSADSHDATVGPTRRRPHTKPSPAAHPINLDELLDDQMVGYADYADPTDDLQNGSEPKKQNVIEPAAAPEPIHHLELRSPEPSRQILKPRVDNGYQNFLLGGNTGPTSTLSAAKAGSSTLCPSENGTQYKSEAGIPYEIVCNIDFEGNDYPFEKVQTFEDCVQKCDAFNYIHHHVLCIAALYVPSRNDGTENCYLKSSVSNPSKSTLEIHGVLRLSDVQGGLSSTIVPADSSTSAASKPTSTSGKPSLETRSTTSDADNKTASAVGPTPSSPPKGNQPAVTYAKGNSVIEPKVSDTHLLGPSLNTPTDQFVEYKPPKSLELNSNLLKVGVNGDLSTDFDLSLQTGVLKVNSSTKLKDLDGPPHLSRDGGQGGYVNGQHLFIFCDTGSYTTATDSKDGKFLGFVSSSVAVDTGMNGLNQKALDLQDGIGQWSDSAGRMRGFAPLTEGEQSYNQKMQGKGQRYAIWPESSIIPLDAETGIIYAPIVYDDVDLETRDAKFTYTGATLLTITIDEKAGPVAERPVPKIWDQEEIGWGAAGGIRSWGASGIGGDDGSVYLFGNIDDGVLLARTSPADIADRDSFEYWNGDKWIKDMPTHSSKNSFIEGPFMDIDVFYSPRHLTFIIVYMTKYADNTFYFRYLKADQGILPPFAPGAKSDGDYVENILKYDWSEQEIVYKAPKSLSGKYVYGGSVHTNYYGSDDIVNGGSKMLLSWTAPTGEDPASKVSEYQLLTAEIVWE